MNLSAPVTTLPGIGPAVKAKLANLEIYTLFDLLYHIPFRYEDRTRIFPVSSLQPGETVTVIGTFSKAKNNFTRRGSFIQTGQILDSSGEIPVVWFNQPFIVKNLKNAEFVAFHGKVDIYNRQKCLLSPDYELVGSNFQTSNLLHMGRIVPIYPETRGLTSKWFRTKLNSILQTLQDTDPWPAPTNLPNWKASLQNIHFPQPVNYPTSLAHYKSRLAFDEIFLLQINSLFHRQVWNKTRLSHPFALDKTQVQKFISDLPFNLTTSQLSAVKDILSDLADVKPMNRLLEGDVGSGKTVVAAIAAYIAHLNNFQTLILAPTQILAHQHFQTLTSLFQPYGIQVSLVTSDSKLKIASPELAERENSKLNIVVGTHALLSSNYNFSAVGLVVIDEQHRFGVIQRSLAAQKGQSPHILTMTATPIPRSLALTQYGDLDLSLLSDLPPGRLPVKTWVVPESKRESAYNWIKKHLSDSTPLTGTSGLPAGAAGLPAGRQAFWVCPFIEPSDSQISVKAATQEFDKLKNIFSQFSLGLLHGKLKAGEKDKILDSFKRGEYHILVCTPVVEVGIDVPKATLMVVEDADKFGLAQLHQLRGRVGRNSQNSYCLLFSTHTTPRLKAMENHTQGVHLAEIDFKIRGAGYIYGTSQHGRQQFKIATTQDFDLAPVAKDLAKNTLTNLNKYPALISFVKQDKIDVIEPN